MQIAGRVGRKIGHESGEVIFLGRQKTNKTKKAINEIKKRNDVSGM